MACCVYEKRKVTLKWLFETWLHALHMMRCFYLSCYCGSGSCSGRSGRLQALNVMRCFYLSCYCGSDSCSGRSGCLHALNVMRCFYLYCPSFEWWCMGLQVCDLQSACLLYVSHKGGQRHRHNGNLLLTCVGLTYEWHSLTYINHITMRTKTTSLTCVNFMHIVHTTHRPTNQTGANFMLKAFNRWHSIIQHTPNKSTHKVLTNAFLDIARCPWYSCTVDTKAVVQS
jgi:hypothetical protein